MLIVKVKNLTGTFGEADYHYEAWVNDKMIASGRADGFMRRWGYAALLRRISEEIEANGDPQMETEEG